MTIIFYDGERANWSERQFLCEAIARERIMFNEERYPSSACSSPATYTLEGPFAMREEAKHWWSEPLRPVHAHFR